MLMTPGRISQSLSDKVNERIRMRTREDIEHYREHPDQIDERLQELDREWSLERLFHTNAAALALAGALLGSFRHRRWFFLSVVPSVFLILHGLLGWAPPVEGLRRGGIRTMQEIDEERCELKSIKGQ